MKCSKCKFAFSDVRKNCPKCGLDQRSSRITLGINIEDLKDPQKEEVAKKPSFFSKLRKKPMQDSVNSGLEDIQQVASATEKSLDFRQQLGANKDDLKNLVRAQSSGSLIIPTSITSETSSSNDKLSVQTSEPSGMMIAEYDEEPASLDPLNDLEMFIRSVEGESGVQDEVIPEEVITSLETQSLEEPSLPSIEEFTEQNITDLISEVDASNNQIQSIAQTTLADTSNSEHLAQEIVEQLSEEGIEKQQTLADPKEELAEQPVDLEASPTVAPQIMEFGDGAEGWEEQLDELIGTEVLNVESVAVEKKEKYIDNTNPASFILDDDMEISIEFEVEGMEEDTLAETFESPAGAPSDELLGGLVSAFEQIGKQTSYPQPETLPLIPESAAPSPSLNPDPTSENIPKLTAEAQATIQAKEKIIEELSTLLAEAYGVPLESIIQEDPLISLGKELEVELAELMSLGNSFVQVEGLEETKVKTVSEIDEIAALQQKLSGEIEHLIKEGTTPISAEKAGGISNEINIEDELAELARLSGDIEEQSQRVELDHNTSPSSIDITETGEFLKSDIESILQEAAPEEIATAKASSEEICKEILEEKIETPIPVAVPEQSQEEENQNISQEPQAEMATNLEIIQLEPLDLSIAEVQVTDSHSPAAEPVAEIQNNLEIIQLEPLNLSGAQVQVEDYDSSIPEPALESESNLPIVQLESLDDNLVDEAPLGNPRNLEETLAQQPGPTDTTIYFLSDLENILAKADLDSTIEEAAAEEKLSTYQAEPSLSIKTSTNNNPAQVIDLAGVSQSTLDEVFSGLEDASPETDSESPLPGPSESAIFFTADLEKIVDEAVLEEACLIKSETGSNSEDNLPELSQPDELMEGPQDLGSEKIETIAEVLEELKVSELDELDPVNIKPLEKNPTEVKDDLESKNNGLQTADLEDLIYQAAVFEEVIEDLQPEESESVSEEPLAEEENKDSVPTWDFKSLKSQENGPVEESTSAELDKKSVERQVQLEAEISDLEEAATEKKNLKKIILR